MTIEDRTSQFITDAHFLSKMMRDENKLFVCPNGPWDLQPPWTLPSPQPLIQNREMLENQDRNDCEESGLAFAATETIFHKAKQTQLARISTAMFQASA